MRKRLLTIISAVALASFFHTACAEESKDTSTAKTTIEKKAPGIEKLAKIGSQGDSVMTRPVNFSTSEDVEKTLQNIREKEGDKAYNELKNTMQYLLFYDLSVANNKQKLYKKLDGKTPEQIIAQAQR